MRRVGAALAMTVALAGCGPDLGPLSEARARWAQDGPASYRYAFATTGFASPLEVTVRAGAVEQVVRTGTGLPDTSGAGQTVEQLFLDVQGRLRSSCAVTARYDASLGFPLSAYSDCGQEGSGWVVSGFQAL